jgi:hypothetical protein
MALVPRQRTYARYLCVLYFYYRHQSPDPGVRAALRVISGKTSVAATARKGYSAFNGYVILLTPMPTSSKRLRLDMEGPGRRPTRTNVSICALRASRARKTQQYAARCRLQKQPAAAAAGLLVLLDQIRSGLDRCP